MVPRNCNLCPRSCGVNRQKVKGICLGNDKLKISSSFLHRGEEDLISGKNGSGTVFFSGCNLRCIFCQNHELRDGEGSYISIEELSKIFLDLEEKKAHNINLVSPTHYRTWIVEAIKLAKDKGLTIPIIWNTSGYENLTSIDSLKDYVDIWLYDFKFYSNQLAYKMTGVKNYFEYAYRGLERITNDWDLVIEDGIMKKGCLVRILILPNYMDDAREILKKISVFKDRIILNLMGQYYPPRGLKLPKEISRRLTYKEYEVVRKEGEKLGFKFTDNQ